MSLANKLGISSAASIQKYAPGQARDDRGRFASGGGSVSAGSGTVGVGTPSPAATAAAKGLKHYNHPIPKDSNIDQADAFERMVHDPSDPRVRQSYESFETVLMEQWHHLANEGYTYSPQGDAPGYADSRALIEALDGKHMRVYLTEGGGDFPSDHPMLKPVSVEGLGPRPVLNDVFRAVHDTIGHGVSGGSFGVMGERAAWLAHRDTFPSDALPALWNETRGQAAWTNAGPHMQSLDITGKKYVRGKKDPGFIPLPNRPFSEQKAGWPLDAGAQV